MSIPRGMIFLVCGDCARRYGAYSGRLPHYCNRCFPRHVREVLAANVQDAQSAAERHGSSVAPPVSAEDVPW